MKKLMFGIDYVCKFVQFLFPWLILDENNNNNNKWDKINILKKSKFGKINNKYLDIEYTSKPRAPKQDFKHLIDRFE